MNICMLYPFKNTTGIENTKKCRTYGDYEWDPFQRVSLVASCGVQTYSFSLIYGGHTCPRLTSVGGFFIHWWAAVWTCLHPTPKEATSETCWEGLIHNLYMYSAYLCFVYYTLNVFWRGVLFRVLLPQGWGANMVIHWLIGARGTHLAQVHSVDRFFIYW